MPPNALAPFQPEASKPSMLFLQLWSVSISGRIFCLLAASSKWQDRLQKLRARIAWTWLHTAVNPRLRTNKPRHPKRSCFCPQWQLPKVAAPRTTTSVRSKRSLKILKGSKRNVYLPWECHKKCATSWGDKCYDMAQRILPRSIIFV